MTGASHSGSRPPDGAADPKGAAVSPGRAERLKAFLKAEAERLGFCALAVTPAKPAPASWDRLAEFVALGRHGSMQWLAETLDRRADPQALWPEARSVIVLAMNYGPDCDPLENLARPGNASISVYARNRDYHDIIKGKLKELAGKFASRAGGDVKVFVDTAPVMEKPLAQAAGLGWIGKHTNLVSRNHGSWIFLSSIFTTVDLAADAPEIDHCGSCRACLDACPTEAFPAPYQIDARALFRANSVQPSATASMAATIAWRPAPGTSTPRPPARRNWSRATICARRRCRAFSPWMTRRSGLFSPALRSSASAVTGFCAMC